MDNRLFELLKAYLSSGADVPNHLDFHRRLNAIIDIYKREENTIPTIPNFDDDIKF